MDIEGDDLEGSDNNNNNNNNNNANINSNGKRPAIGNEDAVVLDGASSSSHNSTTIVKPTPPNTPPQTTSSLGRGVCRIEVTRVEWNPIQPWQRMSQSKSSGTGFCISGKRILTNAHVVKSAVDIRVRLFGSTRRVSAKTMVYAPEVDLAILEIPVAAERAAFFQSGSGSTTTTKDGESGANKRLKTTASSPLALELATELPALQETVRVVGFPTGGKTICVTEGVVSRIDCDSSSHLTIQVDSAINPGNSGGPALNRYGQVTGVAFRKRTAASNEYTKNDDGHTDSSSSSSSSSSDKNMKAGTKVVDNIGYLIPAGVVQAFLGRIQERRTTTTTAMATSSTTTTPTPSTAIIKPTYTLAASVPYRWHSLENHSLRLAHRVPDSIHGVLITSVYNNCRNSNSNDNPTKEEEEENLESPFLHKGDVLTKIDGKEIADDGQVVLRGDELIQHAYLMKLKPRQEPIRLEFFRPPPQSQGDGSGNNTDDGKSSSPSNNNTDNNNIHSCKIWLRDIPTIIPRWDDVDCQPNYLILGACVLLPFNIILRHYNKCGSLLKADCIDWGRKWPNEWQDKKGLVVLTDILAHELTFSYQRRWRRVVKYNGIDIRSLEHLRDLWQASCKEQEDLAAAVVQSGDTVPATNPTTTNDNLKFVRLELENDDDLVFEVSAAVKAQAEVMKTYEIPKAHQILPPNPNYVP